MSADERIRYLTASENRVNLLSALEDGPVRPSALAGELSISRSAIQRNLRAFLERGWARRTDEGYVPTFGGRLVLHRYRELVETVGFVEEYGEYLDALADVGLALTPADFEAMTITTATRNDPHAPLRRYAARVAGLDATSFRGITPVVSPVFNRAHRELLSETVDAELIIDEDALSASQTGYPDALEDAIEADTLTLYVHPGSLSFGLSLFDGRAFVGIYDESGQFVACFESGADSFCERVRTVYEHHREAARPIEAVGMK